MGVALMVVQLLSHTTDHEQIRKQEQKKRGKEQQEQGILRGNCQPQPLLIAK